jgi:hypothetical protein
MVRKASVGIDGDESTLDTQQVMSGQAVAALAAADDGLDGDGIARLQVDDLGALFLNDTAHFVTGNHIRPRPSTEELVQIAAAHTATHDAK